ncbi:hypothetical protein LTR78_006818 [Recurvomyces mirabilis]|uniref:Rab-GAP TBC domain-containing protein n=1 Tax=Recurvomyces mirabilis TaxID=574656 RepID=A0AAE0WK94_9PEZI|nr:hypothetical protein LTR78_006818 [Recurvomyces mirabilis]
MADGNEAQGLMMEKEEDWDDSPMVSAPESPIDGRIEMAVELPTQKHAGLHLHIDTAAPMDSENGPTVSPLPDSESSPKEVNKEHLAAEKVASGAEIPDHGADKAERVKGLTSPSHLTTGTSDQVTTWIEFPSRPPTEPTSPTHSSVDVHALSPGLPIELLAGSLAELPAERHHETTPPSSEPGTSVSERSAFKIDTAPIREASREIIESPLLSTPSTDRPYTPRQTYSPSSDYGPGIPHVPVSPLTTAEASVRLSTYRDSVRDSMASIALSESSLDYDHLSPEAVEEALSTPRVRASRHTRKPSSLEILQNMWGEDMRPTLVRQGTLFDATKDQASPVDPESNVWNEESTSRGLQAPVITVGKRTSSLFAPKRRSDTSGEDLELDWQQLDKEEQLEKGERETEDGAEDESTAFLLARLEQENAKIESFSSSTSSVGSHAAVSRLRKDSKPPSMGHLKKLVQDRSAPSVRYSLALTPGAEISEEVPEPPPMTELEFWAALVQDYPSTAARLPTLATTKIRGGIPPPLRGVVWQSMAGARDRSLEDSFEKLQHESSPYEGIINKDVGRSFPGVELFRDAEGEGQKMLGRVLKCFSLHDKDIGYCQGLGFLVGPLLMNMGEREAFCVLVRLMEHYTLRPSFLPSLSGLHMRIFQFSSLLKQHHSALSEHLTNMGVEPAYLSQWFLSCFAVTCPLPMLFRIYDVIFAEGANETVMRVALALMRRNEQRMMESTEFEEVMQLLLGRGIWDCYGIDADALVDDFTSLGGIITHARLAELEREFEKHDSDAVGQSAGFLPDVQAAASRFLGRLWAPSHSSAKSTSTLSPSTAENEAGGKKKSAGFLRRSASKQSISTLNESSGSESSSNSASTSATDPEINDSVSAMRESQATDAMSFKSKADSLRTVSFSTPGMSKEEKDMHGQIEDLLTALGEMQREQQVLAGMLQREREERGEDQIVVRRLVKRLRKNDDRSEADAAGDKDVEKEQRRRTMPPPARIEEVDGGTVTKQRPTSVLLAPKKPVDEETLDDLVETVHDRLDTPTRFSHSFETKAQLRSSLTRTCEQLAVAETSSRDLATRLDGAETSLAAFTTESEDLRSEVKELRVRVNEEFKARQKLEHTISNLRAEARSIERKERERVARAESGQDAPATGSKRDSMALAGPGGLKRTESFNGVATGDRASGLRELRLVRRESTSSIHSLRAPRAPRPTLPEISIQTQSPVDLAASPPHSATEDTGSPLRPMSIVQDPLTPISAPTPTTQLLETPLSAATLTLGTGLAVPQPTAMWHARTSSLATREVFSTPEHSAVPEEALLLELVNAKTSEATSRAEAEESRRALTLSNRRHEQMLAALQGQIEAANASANAARLEATAARAAADGYKLEAEAAQAAIAAGSGGYSGLSVPNTPATYDGDTRSFGSTSETVTPVEKGPEVPPKEKAVVAGSASSGGGWFWNRRSPSTTIKVAVTPPAVE